MFRLPKMIKLRKRKEDQKNINIGVQNYTNPTQLTFHVRLVQELLLNNLFQTDTIYNILIYSSLFINDGGVIFVIQVDKLNLRMILHSHDRSLNLSLF